jgi:predicted glycosyltransferase
LNKKVLIDINHPAHVHFFRHPISLLRERGCEILITARDKDVTVDLLDALGLSCEVLSSSRQGALGLLSELFSRNRALYGYVRHHKPDVMLSIGGTFIAHVGLLTGVPSLVFYDTEEAKIQNLITYPFATRVIVPECYRSWLPSRSERYCGFHETSYLHPDYFQPDRAKAIDAGLKEGVPNYLIRLVSWEANHDIGLDGWNEELLQWVVETLGKSGNVIISTERALPASLCEYEYRGDVGSLHDLLAFCEGYIGESATIASEAVALGVPSIYAASSWRGYCLELEEKYDLLRNCHQVNRRELMVAMEWLLDAFNQGHRDKYQRYLEGVIDVAGMVADLAMTWSVKN